MLKKTQIAFFIPSMAHLAGTERAVTTLANSLASLNNPGIDIHVIEHTSKNDGKLAFLLHPNVKMVSLFKEKDLQLGRIHRIYKLMMMLRALQIQYMVVSDWNNPLFTSMISKLCGVKTLYWAHFNFLDILQRHPIGPFKYAFVQFMSKMVNQVIALTMRDKRLWEGIKNAPKNIGYIPHFVEQETSSAYNSDSHVVIAVGRLTPQKGFDFLLKVWERLMRNPHNKDWKLVVVGDKDHNFPIYDEYAQSLHDKAAKLDNVIMHPATPDIDALYQDSGIFAFTSRKEGFGLVLAEAQAHGLPAVSFDIPSGPSDIIENGKTGYLVKPYSVEKFAQALQKLMDSKALREKFSKASLQHSQKFDKPTILKKWQSVLGCKQIT